MMRVTREKAAENREKIVATAARLFRENGFDGVGGGRTVCRSAQRRRTAGKAKRD
jgi:hypothetical protein